MKYSDDYYANLTLQKMWESMQDRMHNLMFKAIVDGLVYPINFGVNHMFDSESGQYDAKQAMVGIGMGPQQITLRKKMELENIELDKRIAINNELIKLLDENPAIEKFMNLSRGILR